MAGTGSKALLLLERAQRAARMRIAGRTEAEIAMKLQVSASTARRDLQRAAATWKALTAQSLEEARREELARLAEVERGYWEAWEQSRQDRETTTTRQVLDADKNVIELSTVKREGQMGKPAFLQGVLACIDRRHKLLDLDDPPRRLMREHFDRFREEQEAAAAEPTVDGDCPNFRGSEAREPGRSVIRRENGTVPLGRKGTGTFFGLYASSETDNATGRKMSQSPACDSEGAPPVPVPAADPPPPDWRFEEDKWYDDPPAAASSAEAEEQDGRPPCAEGGTPSQRQASGGHVDRPACPPAAAPRDGTPPERDARGAPPDLPHDTAGRSGEVAPKPKSEPPAPSRTVASKKAGQPPIRGQPPPGAVITLRGR